MLDHVLGVLIGLLLAAFLAVLVMSRRQARRRAVAVATARSTAPLAVGQASISGKVEWLGASTPLEVSVLEQRRSSWGILAGSSSDGRSGPSASSS